MTDNITTEFFSAIKQGNFTPLQAAARNGDVTFIRDLLLNAPMHTPNHLKAGPLSIMQLRLEKSRRLMC